MCHQIKVTVRIFRQMQEISRRVLRRYGQHQDVHVRRSAGEFKIVCNKSSYLNALQTNLAHKEQTDLIIDLDDVAEVPEMFCKLFSEF